MKQDILFFILRGAFALLLSILFCDAAVADGKRPPNILLLMADDLGYGDLGSYGNREIRTPHLDRLAAEGLRLTQFYSASPVCSPSRVALMTGRIPQREGILDWIPFDSPIHLRRDAPTLATMLRARGYATALTGKWHLNGKFDGSQPNPNDHGFDDWFATGGYPTPSQFNPDNFHRNGARLGAIPGYSSTIIANEAIDWLKRRDPARPFFLFVSFHAPHEEIASAPRYVKMYETGRERNRALYYANVTEMDFEIGRVLQALDEAGIGRETIVLFTSDNGPEVLDRKPFTPRSYGTTGGLRGMKLDLYEGGIRVPAIVRWPGVVSAGRASDAVTWMPDLLPTLCAAAGAPRPRAIDGRDLGPLLRGGGSNRPRALFWQYDNAHTSEPNDLPVPKLALRQGDWKLLSHAGFRNFELYHLGTDPRERLNLADREPSRVRAMANAMRRFYDEVNVDRGRRQ